MVTVAGVLPLALFLLAAAPAAASTAPAAAVGGTVPATETVTITDHLRPAQLNVAAGTTVTWVNEDDRRHRVRSRNGPVRFDSGNLDPGAAFVFTFVAEGTYAYLDERNDDDPAYHGTVTVRAGNAPGNPTEGRTSGPGGAQTADPADSPATSAAVAALDRSFSPSSVSISAGGTVEWTNASDRDHTVTFRDGADGSDAFGPGGTYTHTFPSAGTVRYFCAIHPEMTGTVTVIGDAGAGSPSNPQQAPSETPGVGSGTPADPEGPQQDGPAAPDGVEAPSVGAATAASVTAEEGVAGSASAPWLLVLAGVTAVVGAVAGVRWRRRRRRRGRRKQADVT